MKRRVTVGAGEDYPATVAGITQALGDEHQHVVFKESLVPFDATLDLAVMGGNSPRLTFDVEGVPSVKFLRQPGFTGPLVKRINGDTEDMMRMYWRNITLDGNAGVGGLAHNMKIP